MQELQYFLAVFLLPVVPDRAYEVWGQYCFPAVFPHVAGWPLQCIILARFLNYLHRLNLSDQILFVSMKPISLLVFLCARVWTPNWTVLYCSLEYRREL